MVCNHSIIVLQMEYFQQYEKKHICYFFSLNNCITSSAIDLLCTFIIKEKCILWRVWAYCRLKDERIWFYCKPGIRLNSFIRNKQMIFSIIFLMRVLNSILSQIHIIISHCFIVQIINLPITEKSTKQLRWSDFGNLAVHNVWNMKAIEHLGNHILFTIQLEYILVINKIRAVDAREQFSKISSFVEAVQSGVQKDHTDIYYEYAPQVSYYDTRINLPFKNKKFYKALIFAKLFRIFAHFKNRDNSINFSFSK